ncbi:hypothetical protein D3C87_2082560 [compost metagenome]
MPVEGGICDGADLFLVVADLGVAAAFDQVARQPGVVFGVAVVAIAADVIDAASDRGGGVG